MKNSNYKNKNVERKYSNTWHDCLINRIPEHKSKVVGGFKDKAASLFNTNTPR